MINRSNGPSPERNQLSHDGETSPPVILDRSSGELSSYTAVTAKALHSRLGGDCSIQGQSVRGWFPRQDILLANSWRVPAIDLNQISTFEELCSIPLTRETRQDVSSMSTKPGGIFVPVDGDSLLVNPQMFGIMRITSHKGDAFVVTSLKEAAHYLLTGELNFLQADCEVIARAPGSPIENVFGHGFYVSSELQSTLGVPALHVAGYLLLVSGPYASDVEDGPIRVERINLQLVKPGQTIWEGPFGALLNKAIGHEKLDPLDGGNAE